MRSRLELHQFLCDILGSNQVYFQPPATIQMNYPAIVYSLNGHSKRVADNRVFFSTKGYGITVIDKDPESEIADRLMEDVRFSFDRHYRADNLNHFTFTTYLR